MRITLYIFLLFTTTGLSASEWFPVISGWDLQEEERVYHPSDLWELINGAAQAFLDYGFTDLHLAEYIDDERIVRVEIYRHMSETHAYGMYAAERMPDYEQVEIGAQGYASEGILSFFAGPYYIKIMQVGPAWVSATDIRMISEQVEGHLGQPSAMPAMLSLLPEEGMEHLSDRYIAANFLGYSFLHSAYAASYEHGDRFQLFIIHEAPEEIAMMLDRYRAVMREDRFRQKGTYFVVNDMFNGTIFLSLTDAYLIGVVDTEDETTAVDYMNRVMEKILHVESR